MNTPLNASILLVEDMEEMRNILRRLLGAMGFTKVNIARNGEEAWSLIQVHSYDLVLCDWNMPRISGHELLKMVRADIRFLSLPFIMITGENSAEQVKTAIADGVTDFIIKPFTAALLDQRIRLRLDLPPVPTP